MCFTLGLLARKTPANARFDFGVQVETHFRNRLPVQFAPPKLAHDAPEPFAHCSHKRPPGSGVITQQPVDDLGHVFPIGSLDLELLAAGSSELIEAGAPVVLSGVPLPANEAAVAESDQRRVESAHVQLNRSMRYLLNAGSDRVAVRLAQDRKGLQHHQIECALQNIASAGPGFSICHPNKA